MAFEMGGVVAVAVVDDRRRPCPCVVYASYVNNVWVEPENRFISGCLYVGYGQSLVCQTSTMKRDGCIVQPLSCRG